VFIEAGDQHTCAVMDTAALRCWGNSDFGQHNETPAFAGDVPLL
jgi:hypothetical protein